ncbi:ATP-binding cassette domain-containing protein [Selenomonas sp. WCA-380-WT-3B 3/]|uniref:ATP-binding cassette domain-containing protein n=2 Tax=Selenomonas montiformis TaxID=2652285 RepID=A0A6I2UZU1_9FIRM|nr:ATP-binding cassette domain-containing protein [Selenomonas montiformis]
MIRLTFSGVTKCFDGRTIIRNFSAEALSGQITAVTGINGSGKSTLLKLAAGLLLPDTGSVIVREDGSVWRKNDRCRRVGMVAPDMHVYSELTARENLDFFLGFRYNVPLSDRQYDELMSRVGLQPDAILKKRVRNFSTGMEKRLHLAILLASGADVWLLDEPGAHLDRAGRCLVQREARRAAEEGKLVLWATNDAEEEAEADASIALSGR